MHMPYVCGPRSLHSRSLRSQISSLLTILPTLLAIPAFTMPTIHTAVLDSTSTLFYAQHPVVTGSTTSGKPIRKQVTFHLLLRHHAVTPTVTHTDTSGSDATNSGSETVYIHTITDDGTSIGAPPGYIDAVTSSMMADDIIDAATPTIPIPPITGQYVITPQPHGTSRLTLTLETTHTPPPTPHVRGSYGSPGSQKLSLVTRLSTRSVNRSVGWGSRTPPHSPLLHTPKGLHGRLSAGTSPPPAAIPNHPLSTTKSFLTHLSTSLPTLQKTYARNAQVDAALHAATIALMPHAPPLTPLETSMIAEVLNLDSQTDAVHWTRIPNTIPSPIQYFQKSAGTIDGDAATAATAHIGKAVALIDAGVAQVFSWLWCFESHERVQAYYDKVGDELRFEELVKDCRSKVITMVSKIGYGFDYRLFSGWLTWVVEPDTGCIILAFEPVAGLGNDPVVARTEAKVRPPFYASFQRETRANSDATWEQRCPVCKPPPRVGGVEVGGMRRLFVSACVCPPLCSQICVAREF